MDFHEAEALDGLRFAWNVWPSSRIEAARLVIPFGVLFTPLKVITDAPVLGYEPVHCKTCRAVLNPYCRVDFQGKIWICIFCYQRNHFPPHYAEISENSLPAELFPNYTVVEYQLPHTVQLPPVFLFVVDTTLSEEDLQAVKDALLQLITLLPGQSLVGLITYGHMVQIHELGYSDCPKAYVFRGEREPAVTQLQELLSIGVVQHPRGNAPQAPGGAGVGRFLLPLADCEFALSSSIEELQADAYQPPQGKRPLRATGAAIAAAVGLLEICVPNVGSRIMTFVSGPTTHGPGLVVGPDLGEAIRSHQDFEKDAAPHYKKSCKFYQSLTSRLVNSGHVLDMFACSLDQVGLAEAKMPVDRTGGMMVLAETFSHSIFKQSLQRMFRTDEEGHLRMAFNATMEVMTTREVKICGAIGPCASLEKKMACVSENVMGQGGTSSWKLCTLNISTAIALYFEVVNQHSNAIPAGQPFFFQFLTRYQHANGQYRLRVVTAARTWCDGTDLEQVGAGFDQEAAAVLMARVATYKAEYEESFDVLRWLDRNLIRLAAKFGEYTKDDAQSFRLSPNFSFFPQFMFHLRRSQLLQVFNNSPDETAFFRLMLNREGVLQALVMIQPTLLSYSFEGPPVPVLLDVSSVAADCILLLDSYFHVVIQYGTTIAQWRKLGYHNDPAHENFRKLLEAPHSDAEELIEHRCPVPRLVECDQGGSQARFLLAKLNPSVTHNSQSAGTQEVIFTDDVSLQVFMEHLQRLAVQQ
eukprot:jgi/Chlat1/7147/Chrsp57S06816